MNSSEKPAVCPSCSTPGMSVFYSVHQVPVHSVLLLPTREAALTYPRGDIALGFCRSCGFISNTAFDPGKHEYSEKYEETQGFSSTFVEFHRDLARRLIERHGLHGKHVIEIGCGKGEFLALLCELGNMRGVGFDPAYVEERNLSPARDRMGFVRDFYSEKYMAVHGDIIVCKMTLEHIPDVAKFVGTVRRSIGDRRDTIVFFMIPEVRRILTECAFWDVYYEHCSYFSAGSLARLFRASGFNVDRLGTEYDGQYLTIEAQPSDGLPTGPRGGEESPEELERDVREFTRRIEKIESEWGKRLGEYRTTGKRVAIWGAGSKGVAFLTKLNVSDDIPCAVDINPYKHGTFMAGTGQEIVGPEHLKTYKPDVVIVMNPIYMGEVRRSLDGLGISPELLPITSDGR